MAPLSRTPVTVLFGNLAQRFGVPFPILSLIIIKIDGLKPVYISPNQINFYGVLQNFIQNHEKEILERRRKEQIAVDLALTVLVKVDINCPPKMILQEF